MVSRLGCLFSGLVSGVSLRFIYKSSFWNKGREPSFKDSLLTPFRRKEASFQEVQHWFRIQQKWCSPMRLENLPRDWKSKPGVLWHHLRARSLSGSSCLPQPPTPTPSIGSANHMHHSGTAQGSRLSQHSPNPISEGVIKFRDHENLIWRM